MSQGSMRSAPWPQAQRSPARDLYYPFERNPRDTPRARPRAMTAMFGEICALYEKKAHTIHK